MFKKLFSAIILGVGIFRVFEILEHLLYEQLKTEDPLHGGDDTWVKVFRIIPENMILRLTFESQHQNAEFCR